ncbi:hypothetical protein CMQ_3195 [Grosmannia clavigera kw1407]|uniref:Condensation domain-containing protein n=1 Tax=Grosmannia clavigera (strain kw1407 / UAMH 11150) TaxID=655863 RepID=F0XI90_GROCL|nr:uncharacterized protein CMQ_3195 [Grosmannia clavigera kw1407]EFX03266.1 hypothetical protein CMQ_3195 [Grosmannia clavigera kw1407]
MRVNIVGYRYKLPVRWRLPGLRNDLMATCEEAVARVVLRHPHMHVGITGEHTRNPHWVRLRELDLNNHINWTLITPRAIDYQKALGSVVGQELDTRFADYQNVPRWRLRILHQEGEDSIDILFSFCHIAVDGSSVKMFHRELLQSLRGGSEAAGEINVKDHILVLPEDSTTTFSPPAENLVQFPVDLKALVYYWQNEVEISTAAYPKKPRQAHWAPIQTTPYKTQIRSIYIPGDALSRLIAACHHQKTTMTGLLHALAAVSLARLS